MLKNLRLNLAALLIASVALCGGFISSAVHAGAFTDYFENKLVDWMVRGQAYTPPASLYLGLDTVACTEAGGGTEVTGGSYARVAYTSSLANWAGTQGAGTTVASSGTSGTTSNNAVATFPAPTASWGTVVSFRIWDASTAGNALICQALTTSKTINNGDAAPSFAAGSLTIQVDN